MTHKTEVLEAVRKLAKEGLYAREIARRLHLTKNQVIGLCYRHGVKLPGRKAWT